MKRKNHKVKDSNITRVSALLLVTSNCKLKIARFIGQKNVFGKKKV